MQTTWRILVGVSFGLFAVGLTRSVWLLAFNGAGVDSATRDFLSSSAAGRGLFFAAGMILGLLVVAFLSTPPMTRGRVALIIAMLIIGLITCCGLSVEWIPRAKDVYIDFAMSRGY
jgi:hypothetical protein